MIQILVLLQESSSASEGGKEGRRRRHFPAVGIDAEWEPRRWAGFSPVTLLQIATRQRAFLVDLKQCCSALSAGYLAQGMSPSCYEADKEARILNDPSKQSLRDL